MRKSTTASVTTTTEGETDTTVVVVNPGYMFGPLDSKPSSGRLVADVANGRVPGTTPEQYVAGYRAHLEEQRRCDARPFEPGMTPPTPVDPEAWEAVRNLRDQNLLIVNQLCSYLPAEATGQDLNRSILEMLMQNPKASLHNVVSDVLSHEAKKLMI